MAILDRETLPPTISFKGLVYSALLLLLVVSLFFIPEIITLQEKITSGAKVTGAVSSLLTNEKKLSSNEIDIDEVLQASRSGASLDSILNMVESRLEASSDSSNKISVPAPATKSDSTPLDVNVLSNREILEQALVSKQITWEQLSSSQVKNSLKSAQNNAIKILRNLPPKQSSVRFALINYINGIGWLAKNDRKLMSAEEAMAYIEQLDINVTQAMISSEIDASDFEAWKQISIGSVSGITGRAATIKNQTQLPFNPRLTLTSIDIKRDPDYVKRGASWKLDPNPRTSVKVSGFVIGSEAKKISVFKNGRKLTDVNLRVRANESGLRTFKWQSNNANGLYIFRVYTKSGQVFQKMYTFVPKVYQKFKQDEQGYYILPFGQSDSQYISLQSYDQRLDRFFRVGRDYDREERNFEVF